MTDYKEWIKILADYQGGRPNFADQTPESLQVLEKLVEVYNPTVIVELGTAHGLSTRLWLQETGPEVKIHCVDASFDPLQGTASVLPVDLDRLILWQKWVHDVHLQGLWTDEDRVLLYVDIHSDHSHVFKAIEDLPTGSVVVFDDVWRSPKKLETPEDKEAFRTKVVAKQVDHTAPREIWPLSYADYPMGRGGFWGFTEVPELMLWTGHRKVKLHWEIGAKVVWFQWPQDKQE
jgi:hypothetical protein